MKKNIKTDNYIYIYIIHYLYYIGTYTGQIIIIHIQVSNDQI